MAFGIGAPGLSPESHAGEVRFKTLEEYREQMRLITRQGLVDIMLMSASTNYALTIRERLFEDSHVTPAVRANDTTDVHLARGSRYAEHPVAAVPLGEPRPRPVRPPRLRARGAAPRRQPRPLQRHVQQRPRATTSPPSNGSTTSARRPSARGSATSSKSSTRTSRTRSPPTCCPRYLNDMIARMLAGVAPAGRPRVPQDRLPRPEGDGGTGPVRPAPRRRHPRRLGRDDPRRLPAPRTTPRSTAPGSPSSAARSTTPRTSSPSSSSSA